MSSNQAILDACAAAPPAPEIRIVGPNEDSPPDVTVVIVNWNAGALLTACLRSIVSQRFEGSAEVILVDNGSTDGSTEQAAERHPFLSVIRHRCNLGFARAQNEGIRRGRGRHILPLNFDVVLERTFMREMVRAIEQEHDIGIVSGKLLRFKDERTGEIRIDSTGIDLRDYSPAPRGAEEVDTNQYERSELLFGACGAAPLYRRDMLEDTVIGGGYFDSTYFQYVEDVDLSWRALLRGWRCVYAPTAVAHHKRGATRERRDSVKDDYLIRGWRNRYLTMIKNITPIEWRQGWRRLIFKEINLLRAKRKQGRLGMHLRALAGVLLMLPTALLHRGQIQRRARPRLEQLRNLVAPWLTTSSEGEGSR